MKTFANVLFPLFQVAGPVDAYVCGGVSPTVSYKEGCDVSVVKEEFKTMIDIFVQKKVDFLLGEFFGDVKVRNKCKRRISAYAHHFHIICHGQNHYVQVPPLPPPSSRQEAVIAVEAMKQFGGGLPVALTLRAGPTGDFNDVSLQKCAVMLKRAGKGV